LKLLILERRFWPLFWTQFLGALNDNFFKNALVMLITYRSISLMGLSAELLVAMAGGIFILPYFLFSGTAGQIADRYEKSAVIKATKVTELIVMLIASLGFYTDNYLMLMVVLFLMGTQSAFFGPLKYGIIPHIVKPLELVPANAYIGGGTFLAILVGTLTGGAFANLDSPGIPISIGLVLLAIIGILTSLPFKKVHNANLEVKIDYTFFRPSWQTLKLVYKKRNVFRTILGVSWFWFLGAGILSLLPILCKDVLGADAVIGTLLLGTFTVGMGVGSVMTNFLSRGKVELGMVAPAGLFMSFAMFDMYLTTSSWQHLVNGEVLLNYLTFFDQIGSVHLFIDLFFVSAFGGMYIIPQMTYVQEASNSSELSRIISGNNIINALFMVAASVLIMTMHTMNITVPMQFAILACVNFVFSFIVYYINSETTLRFWFWILSNLFYNVKVIGQSNIPEKGPLIICANHVTFIDWWFIFAVSPRPVRFVIDNKYYSMPTGKFWFSQAGLIPIATKKESAEVLAKAFDNISESIQSGDCLGLFPEGWITRDGEMRKFQPGIIKIIQRDPVNIVPISLVGLWGSIFSYEGSKVIFKIPKSLRRKVNIVIGKPITPEEYHAEKVRNEIIHNLENNAPKE
jgi:1-acyl-sn-glycerol-3-phosphate acyltransferase